MKIISKIWLNKKNDSKVVADAQVILRDDDLGDLTIKAVKVINGQEGLFVSLPQFIYEKDGEKKYSGVVWASSDWKEVIDASVINAYNEKAAAPASAS